MAQHMDQATARKMYDETKDPELLPHLDPFDPVDPNDWRSTPLGLALRTGDQRLILSVREAMHRRTENYRSNVKAQAEFFGHVEPCVQEQAEFFSHLEKSQELLGELTEEEKDACDRHDYYNLNRRFQYSNPE